MRVHPAVISRLRALLLLQSTPRGVLRRRERQRWDCVTSMAASANAAVDAAEGAPPAVKETEMLFESTSLFAKMYGWYWPTSEKAAYEAEQLMLAHVDTDVRQRLVAVGKNRINTVEVGSHETATDRNPKRTLVMCHGYGSGLGLWYRNLDSLAAVPGLKTYAIDWLGMGRSSRPSYPIRQSRKAVDVAEDFFVESLEDWRKAMGIESMILLGHSLGGYLAAVYALKYPERVDKLILASPAGVPQKPEEDPVPARPRSFMYSMASFLVDQNVTPQGILRAMGRFGPNLVKKAVDMRLPHIDPAERAAMQQYLYHISVRRGSGEYALNTILSMPAWARKPLIHRLPAMKVPTAFLYGSHDWMDESAARAVQHRMPAGATVYQISDAGHHLYMENARAFNDVLLHEIRTTPASTRKASVSAPSPASAAAGTPSTTASLATE